MTRRGSMTTVAAALAATLLGGGCARAYAPAEPVALAVVDRETGQELEQWRHGGRTYVAGRPGARYALRVANRTGGRVLVVLSVDGVNILTGETASPDQRGYVLGPFESYDLTGWRKSMTEVAAFAFAPQSRSYAARTGRPLDVGVIGMAVFKEKPAPPPVSAPQAAPPPAIAQDRSAGASEYGGRLQRREERLGTAHGEREWSQTWSVAFERATRWPQMTRLIEYDTFEHLAARGVVPRERRWGWGRPPRPFPAGPGFVPDPPPGS